MAQTISIPGEQETPTARRKLNPRLLLVGLAIAVAGYWGWRQLAPAPAATVLRVSGRIEADETDIGAKTGGRIAQILVAEGDRVKAGQVVAILADEEVDQQVQAAIAQVQAARQELAQAQLDIRVIDSRIQEAETTLTQSQTDSQGRVSQSESSLAAATAQVAQAQAQVVQAEAEVKRAAAQLKLAQLDRDRYAELVQQGAINRQQFDQAQTNADTAAATLETAQATLIARQAAVRAAKQQRQAAQGNVTQTEATTLNPAIRQSQLAAYQRQREQAIARYAAVQAKVNAAIAQQQQLQARLNSFQVKSPIAGIVQDRPVEPGAVVTSGKTVLTVIDPNAIYLRAYVPEGDIGKLYPGKPARVLLDSRPQQPLAATVRSIDPKASFTPENIYFQKDRVRQVFGVKLAIAQSELYAKPGMPADAEIDVK